MYSCIVGRWCVIQVQIVSAAWNICDWNPRWLELGWNFTHPLSMWSNLSHWIVVGSLHHTIPYEQNGFSVMKVRGSQMCHLGRWDVHGTIWIGGVWNNQNHPRPLHLLPRLVGSQPAWDEISPTHHPSGPSQIPPTRKICRSSFIAQKGSLCILSNILQGKVICFF